MNYSQITADLHLHSKYSQAVSNKMNLDEINIWAAKKEIDLVATSDWTHPLWINEIETKLKEISPGIYELKNKPINQKRKVNFLLSTEISSIYSQNNRCHRMHNLVFAPNIESAKKITQKLVKHGCKVSSDGRPITGLSAIQILEIVLETDKNAMLIPAHIWTPWFSLFGSRSGFNSIEEAFGKYSKYIYGIETGLSSDPLMNWQIKELQNKTILSFSDAHSGPKLGREATVFVQNKEVNQMFSFQDITDTIKQKDNSLYKVGYTIEFFPEEGKYHFTGHRNCKFKLNPADSKKNGNICPVCHKPLTVGVADRVVELSHNANFENQYIKIPNNNGVNFIYDLEKKHRPFTSIIPLLEILVELNNNSPVKASRQYEDLINNIGCEFDILLRKPIEELEKVDKKLSQAINILRNRECNIDPGYDGEFGKIKVFKEKSQNEEKSKTQDCLF